MTATGHALIGTVIAAKIGNPALAIPIALGSHFLADALPHWDTAYNRRQKSRFKFFMESLIDLVLSFVLAYGLIVLLFPATNIPYAFIIIIFSQLPDWLTAPYLFFKLNFPPFSSMYNLQKKFDAHLGPPWGVINQVVVVVGLIILAKIF
jgi:hypothetical protein